MPAAKSTQLGKWIMEKNHFRQFYFNSTVHVTRSANWYFNRKYKLTMRIPVKIWLDRNHNFLFP